MTFVVEVTTNRVAPVLPSLDLALHHSNFFHFRIKTILDRKLKMYWF